MYVPIKMVEYKVYLNIFLMNHNVYQMQADKSLVSAFDPEPNPILLQVLLLTITTFCVSGSGRGTAWVSSPDTVRHILVIRCLTLLLEWSRTHLRFPPPPWQGYNITPLPSPAKSKHASSLL